MNSYPSANGGASLVTLDGFNVIGNVADVPSNMPNTFVETVGQFQTVDNVKVFNVESWKVYDGYEDGIFGSLQREGESVVMTTEDGAYILPDVPQDVPIPVDNMYATGIKKGDIFEWKTLDNRPSFGGGGGGGGGYGFYKLNLSGTPVPFATPTSDPAIPDANANGYPYVVAAGDTCHSIASMFNLDVNTLIVTNNLAADCSDLTLDQTIIIPYTTAMPPEVAQIRGILSSTIFESADGSQRTQYGLINMSPANVPETFYYYILEGDNLEGLQSYYGRPVDVWGTVERITDDGIVKLRVDRYEIPFPDLQLQVLKGVEKSVQLEGQSVLLFTDGGGNTYVELGQNCYEPVGGKEVPDSGNEIQMEALAVPGLTYAGQPAVCMFNSALLADPNTKKPIELTITADQPSILPEMPSAEAGNLPTITIEKVELIYYLPNQRYLSTSSADPVYIQPIWRFYGHYSDGSVFEALVQALDPLFLLPEFDSDTQPG
jgi:LysM repeat protein